MINEQLYINNISVPLSQSVNAALTKSIQDIREPNKRKATYSKTISLPDSKELREVFDHVFEFNMVDRTFNPLVKANVRYEVGSEVILSGYIQLKDVKTTDEEKFIYQVALVSELGNFFEDIKNDRLEDLDLSEYDHNLTRVAQVDSWETEIFRNGVEIPFELGVGYVYPLVDYGFSSDSTRFDVTEIGISIYAREYWYKIFTAKGYTWTSAFLDSDIFRSLVIPNSPEAYTLTSDEVAERTFTANTPELVSTGATTSNILPDTALSVRDKIINTNEISDVGGIYDPSTGVFTCVDAGSYTYEFTCEINASFIPDNLSVDLNTIGEVQGYIMLHKTPSGGSAFQVAASPFFISDNNITTGVRTSEINPTAPTTDYMVESRIIFSSLGTPTVSAGTPRTINPPDRYNVKITGLEMAVGDQLEVSWKARTNTVSGNRNAMFIDISSALQPGSATIDFPVSSFYSKPENNYTAVGNLLAVNKTIPKNIKQTDFILAFVKMFNLFIEIDPTNPKNLLIEPRDDFYGTDIVNIHEKIDRSRDFIQKPVTDLNALRYIYKYKDDSDYFNQTYVERQQETYGQIEIDVTHDFGKSLQKEEVLFSPTPLVALPSSNRVLPTIQQRNEAGQPVKTKSNIRVLYYGGLKDCNDFWIHAEGGFPEAFRNTYPYAGHFDDPYSPTIDINFGLVKEVFYDSLPTVPITVTNNNLFNKYHAKMIREYTDEDTRIIECYVDINTVDWNEWTFDKTYYLGSGGNYSYCRLYKIFNYNPTSTATTKCQFLRISEASVFIPTENIADGADQPFIPNQTGGQIDTGEAAPSLPSTIYSDGNIGVTRTNSVNGSNNRLSDTTRNVQILGDGNELYGDTKNIRLINSNNNTLDGGVRNVTLINTNGLNITESNVTYVDGVKINSDSLSQPTAVEQISASQDVETDVFTYEVDTTSGNVTVNFNTQSTTFIEGQIWNLKKLVKANNMIISVSGAATIDGASSQTFKKQYTSISVQYTGANFIII